MGQCYISRRGDRSQQKQTETASFSGTIKLSGKFADTIIGQIITKEEIEAAYLENKEEQQYE